MCIILIFVVIKYVYEVNKKIRYIYKLSVKRIKYVYILNVKLIKLKISCACVYNWLVKKEYKVIKIKFIKLYKIIKIKFNKNKTVENVYIPFSVIFADKLKYIRILPLTFMLFNHMSPELILSLDFWYNCYSDIIEGNFSFSRIRVINHEYIIDPATGS